MLAAEARKAHDAAKLPDARPLAREAARLKDGVEQVASAVAKESEELRLAEEVGTELEN